MKFQTPEELLEEAIKKNQENKKLLALMSSTRDDWETPKDFIRNIQNNFGYSFSLDVAASHDNKVCAQYYDKISNGLAKP